MNNINTRITPPPLDTHLPADSTSDVTPHSRKKRGVALESKTWPQHSTVRISLLNMTDEQKITIKKGINEWIPHTNLHFKFVNRDDGDIRISAGTASQGSWSEIGTDALHRAPSEPTMYINFNNFDDEVQADIVHEFGHALSLVHEHQHPQRSLTFNEKATYEHFEKRDFEEHEVHREVLGQFDPSEVKTSKYDKSSIMHYYIPASLLTDGEEVPFPTKLSDGDIKFVKTLYPRDHSLAGKFLYTFTQFIVSRS